MAVSSLFDNALHAVMRDFSLHEHLLSRVPRGVKTRLLKSVTKRGLLSEQNLTIVSWSYYNIVLASHVATVGLARVMLNPIAIDGHVYATISWLS